MKITLRGKGIFGKKYLKIPNDFLKAHEEKEGKAVPINGYCTDDFLILSSSTRAFKKKQNIIDNLLYAKEDSMPDYVIELRETGEEVAYKDVTGFFSFAGEIYHKSKGAAGKHVRNTELTFSDSVKERFPEDFGKYTGPKIGTIPVQPLEVVVKEL